MKRRLLASKRDLTGLVCLVGMGLLVLLAWATLPGSGVDPAPHGNDVTAPAAGIDGPG
ncbi:hypothetical protein DFR24_3829 [Panacagrimonas perspica]|uniref:Uncharacterized protein n=1 Tax=Panacagrimonas perspica TaxID=381431 RepID=A0A4R7P062_9GAMM|nr:hypothetical protein [Panacagrimonas perspica]TDU26798.1 hypothetical protein DFR24_3829 [Panacagrimonas perspica]